MGHEGWGWGVIKRGSSGTLVFRALRMHLKQGQIQIRDQGRRKGLRGVHAHVCECIICRCAESPRPTYSTPKFHVCDFP